MAWVFAVVIPLALLLGPLERERDAEREARVAERVLAAEIRGREFTCAALVKAKVVTNCSFKEGVEDVSAKR